MSASSSALRVVRDQIFVCVAAAVAVGVVCLVGGPGWQWKTALVPLVQAVVAMAVSAWDRRTSWTVALGWPLAFLGLSHTGVWTLVAVSAQSDPICRGPDAPCEGLGIFLALYPFYAVATLVVAAALGGIVRWVGRSLKVGSERDLKDDRLPGRP